MARKRKFKQSRLYAIVAAAVLVFCAVIQIGQYIPSLGIPSWDELFASAGFSEPSAAPEGELQVHFIDVGNADCILIRQGEASALIDAGERGDGDLILAHLNSLGVSKLDIVIATHPHADHIGAMAEVVNTLPIGKFVMSFMPESETPTTATYLNMLEALDDKQVPVDEASPGAVYELGTARLTVLAPLEESKEENNISVVTRLTFGERSFLFMGDAETEVEKKLLTDGAVLTADVLKVGHHGSSTSSSYAFLQRVSPQYAVIPCGVDNSYDHPSDKVLARLDDLNATIYRADVHGHIVFTTDGKKLDVSTEK
ncbi:MAG: MBL fold metallo-hydrolase [Clostridia bacterium]|nr:MBL fold metallo-hydrolase [Clostridia bacterium]